MNTECPECGAYITLERDGKDGPLIPATPDQCPDTDNFDNLCLAHPEWADGLEERWQNAADERADGI